MAKLLVETFADIQVLNETADDGKKSLYLEGIFAQANKPNRNGRIYSQNLLREQTRQYNENYIARKRSIGELNHPDSLELSPERAAILITKLVEDSNQPSDYFYGKAKVLTALPQGKILEGLCAEGIPIGISTRGAGSINIINGKKMVGEDFKLVAIDAVMDPSVTKAIATAIMENVDWIYNAASDNWIAQESMAAKKAEISHNPKIINEQATVKWVEQFLRRIAITK